MANSRSSVSFRVRDGIGSGTPGRLTPLCDDTDTPTITSQRTRPSSTSSTRSRTSPASIRTSGPGFAPQPHEPVVDQDGVAGLQHVADDGGSDRQVVRAALLLRAHRDLLALAED